MKNRLVRYLNGNGLSSIYRKLAASFANLLYSFTIAPFDLPYMHILHHELEVGMRSFLQMAGRNPHLAAATRNVAIRW